MENIYTYNRRMSLSCDDKLWFVRFLSMPIFKINDIVYDFGCASGELIRRLAPLFPGKGFFGIDNSDRMLRIAWESKEYNNEFYIHNEDVLDECVECAGGSVMVMSSVFHEILSYDKEDEFREILGKIKPEYIFFRDMMIDESALRRTSLDDLMNVLDKIWGEPEKDSVYKRQLDSFCEICGTLEIHRNLLHFLLKYRYADNWEREVHENYLPCVYDGLVKKFTEMGYMVVYSRQYVLPYIKETVERDFGIRIMDNTHVNVIFKRIGS